MCRRRARASKYGNQLLDLVSVDHRDKKEGKEPV